MSDNISEHAIKAVRKHIGNPHTPDAEILRQYKRSCISAQYAIDAATAELRAENEQRSQERDAFHQQVVDLIPELAALRQQVERMRVVVEEAGRYVERQSPVRFAVLKSGVEALKSPPAEQPVKLDGTFDSAQREEIRSIAREEVNAFAKRLQRESDVTGEAYADDGNDQFAEIFQEAGKAARRAAEGGGNG